MAIYLTHPEVVMDAAVPVPDWGLSETGVARVAALARRLGALVDTQIVASTERKAVETARPLAALSGRDPAIRADTCENDRSATGFLPPAEFEATANAFFSEPDRSVRGWETARAAQRRIVAAVRTVITGFPQNSLLICGHGAVGTLLYCRLSGLAIDRKWDQPGPGHLFAFDPDAFRALSHWAPIESLSAKLFR